MNKSDFGKKQVVVLKICATAFVVCLITAIGFMGKFGKVKDEASAFETLPARSEEARRDACEATPQALSGKNASATASPVSSSNLKKAVRLKKRTAAAKKNVKKRVGKPARKPAAKSENKTAKSPAYAKRPASALHYVIRRYMPEFPVAGFRYDPAGDFFYADDKNCWQRRAGYNELYDKATPLTTMYIDQLRIRFTYENKDWMIQFWKGQYGFLLVGAEVGVYTAPAGTYTGRAGDLNHYAAASEEDWLKMRMDCYWSKNDDGHYRKVFTRKYDGYWWATGFVKGQLTKYTAPRTELKVKTRITFKSEEMAELFVGSLKQAGFGRAAGADALADDSYYKKDADVWILWSSISQEAFAGYEPAAAKLAAAEPPTTALNER